MTTSVRFITSFWTVLKQKKSIQSGSHLPWSEEAPHQHHGPWCECKWIWRTTLATSRAAGEGSPQSTAPRGPPGPDANGTNSSPGAPTARGEKINRGQASCKFRSTSRQRLKKKSELEWECHTISSSPPLLRIFRSSFSMLLILLGKPLP